MLCINEFEYKKSTFVICKIFKKSEFVSLPNILTKFHQKSFSIQQNSDDIHERKAIKDTLEEIRIVNGIFVIYNIMRYTRHNNEINLIVKLSKIL